MQDHQEAMLKSLVAVAWADGSFHGDESGIIDALLLAFGVDGADADAIREYAKSPRTISDVPLTELSRGDRQLLLQQAVFIVYADNQKTESEAKVLEELVAHLRLPADEASALIGAAEGRAKAMIELL